MYLFLAIAVTVCTYLWMTIVFLRLEKNLQELKVNYANQGKDFLVRFVPKVLILNFAIPYLLVRLSLFLWLEMA